MNKKLIIGGAILGGLGIFAYSIYRYIKVQTSLLENYKYEIKDFRVQKFGTDLIKGQIDVAFTSESDIEVLIKEFALKFYFNGAEVGFLQDIRELVIPAKATSLITLDFTLDPNKILPNITDIIAYSLKQKDAQISVIGFAKLKSGFIEVSLPIKFESSVSELLA
jgi:hypothetical protein